MGKTSGKWVLQYTDHYDIAPNRKLCLAGPWARAVGLGPIQSKRLSFSFMLQTARHFFVHKEACWHFPTAMKLLPCAWKSLGNILCPKAIFYLQSWKISISANISTFKIKKFCPEQHSQKCNIAFSLTLFLCICWYSIWRKKIGLKWVS